MSVTLDPLENFEMAFPFQGMEFNRKVPAMQVHMLTTTLNGVPLGSYERTPGRKDDPSKNRMGIAVNSHVAKDGMKTLDFNEILDTIPRYEDAYDIYTPRDKGRWDHFNEENIPYHMRRSCSYIARVTRRGAGNRYILLDDGIVIFYIGNTAFDTPIVRTVWGNVLNFNYEKFFLRITCDPYLVTQKVVDIHAEYGLLKADDTTRDYLTETYMHSDQMDPYNVKPEKENTPELS